MMYFYFLKIIFDISTSKWSKKPKSPVLKQKKNSKFFKPPAQTQNQTGAYNYVNIVDNNRVVLDNNRRFKPDTYSM